MNIHQEAARFNQRLGHLSGGSVRASEPELILQIDLTDDEMQASLTQGRQLLAVGSIESAGQALKQVEERLTNLLEPSEQKSIGTLIDLLLLPAKIRKALASLASANLTLVLNEPLQTIPWEWALSRPSTERDIVYRLSQHTNPSAEHKLEEQGDLRMDVLSREPVKDETASLRPELQDFLKIRHVESPSQLRNNNEVLVVTDVTAWQPSEVVLNHRLLVLAWIGDYFSPKDQMAMRRWVKAGEAAGCTVWAALHQPTSWNNWFAGLQKIALGETIARSKPTQMAMWSKADLRLRANTDSQDRGYRQAACLAYDLSRSTELMHSISLERYSEVLQACHARFRAVIAKWGGSSDLPQGDDSIMSYFGHMQSTEHATRLAVRAANELIEAATVLNVKIKVGIAHGLLAVSNEHSVGPAIHMASRLRDRAAPMTILLDDNTSEQVRQEFTFNLVEKEWIPKGYPAPVAVWQLTGYAGRSPLQNHAESKVLKTVGRQKELAMLQASWKQAQAAQGHFVLISGEAGIGKSHLVQAWKNQLTTSATVLLCRCYPEFSSEPFWPVSDLISRISNGQSFENKLISNEIKLLLSEIKQAVYPAVSEAGPGAARQQVLQALKTNLLKLSSVKPMCLVIEDFHWADPSTIEWLQSFEDALTRSSCQVVLSSRETQLNWSPSQVVRIELQPLNDQESKELIHSHMGADVAPAVVRGILDRSSGLPIYLSLLARNLQTGQKVPSRLQDLVMQQLDSAGLGKRMAQLLSVLGRKCDAKEFARFYADFSEPAQQAEQSDIEVFQQKLAKAQIIEERSSVIQFRHALIQDIVYQSMWESDRQLLHAFCAKHLISRTDPSTLETNTFVMTDLARHLELAGKDDSAIAWQIKAGKLFKARDSHQESIVQLRKAFALLEKRSALANLKAQTVFLSNEQKAIELNLSLNLAGQLVATKGYGSVEVESIYLRAKALSEQLDDKKSLIRTVLGLEAYYLMQADFKQARLFAQTAENLAQNDQSPIMQSALKFAMANISHHEGRVQDAIRLCEECLAACERMGEQTRLVQSPVVIANMYVAIALWEAGRVEEAFLHANTGVAKARELGQKLALCQALGMHSMLHFLCGDLVRASQLANEAMGFGEKGQLEMWFAHAQIMQGLCMVRDARFDAGFKLIEKAYQQWHQTGTVITRSFYLTVWAQACLHANRPQAALALVDEALELIASHGERYYEPEALRVKALTELALVQVEGADDRSRPRELLYRSLQTAQELDYGSLRLRAAMSLAIHFEEYGALREAIRGIAGGKASEDYRIAAAILSTTD